MNGEGAAEEGEGGAPQGGLPGSIPQEEGNNGNGLARISGEDSEGEAERAGHHQQSEHRNAYEADGFIADDAATHSDAEEDSGLRKRVRGAEDDEDLQLEEEDYELVDEASRPRKRIRKLQRASQRRKPAESSDALQPPADASEPSAPHAASERDQPPLASTTQRSSERQRHSQQRQPMEAPVEEEDDDENLGGFIVDAEDEDEEGAAARKQKRVKKGARQVPLQSVQEAEDIFGDVDDMIERYQRETRAEGAASAVTASDGTIADAGESLEDEANEGEGEEDDVDEQVLRDAGYSGAEIAKQRQQRRQQRQLQRVQARSRIQQRDTMSCFEPGLLHKQYLSDEDERIRMADVPERLQLRERKVGSQKDETNFRPEAQWILERMLTPPTGSSPEYDVLANGELDDKERAYRIEFDEYSERYQYDSRMDEAQTRAREVQEALSPRGGGMPAIPGYEELVSAIECVLNAIHIERQEIPFIAMYRKEDIYPLLRAQHDESWNVTDLQYDAGLSDDTSPAEKPNRPNPRRWEALWAVLDWDSEWMSLKRRRMELEERLPQCVIADTAFEDAEPTDVERETLTKLKHDLQDAKIVEDVDDFSNFVRTFTQERNADGSMESTSRPKYRSLRNIARSKGLHLLAQKFGLEPLNVAENVVEPYQKHMPTDWDESPEAAARTLLDNGMSKAIPDPAEALKQARELFAYEIAASPRLRAYVRQTFFKHAFVSTTPTEQGKFELDPFHPLAKTKHLKRKPVHTFKDDLFIRCLQAEDERLIKLFIDIPTAEKESLRTQIANRFSSDNMHSVATQWNKQRHEIAEECTERHLLPNFREQVRTILQRAGRKRVKADCKEALWAHARLAPYTMKATKDVGNETGYVEEKSIIAACAGTPSSFVAIGNTGELVDYLSLAHVTDRPTNFNQQKPQHDADKAKLATFVQENKPHVIVVGCAGWDSSKLMESVKEACMNAPSHAATPRDVDQIQKIFRDISIARLWEVSAKQTERWGYRPSGVLNALALGRLLLDPLPVICSLAGQEMELRSLQMSTAQRNLGPRELDTAIEEVLVTITNQVGVGLQSIARDSWMSSPLPFVAGLGPRKARHMQSVMQVSERSEVMVQKRVASLDDSEYPFSNGYATDLTATGALTENVCMNALPFLRVDTDDVLNQLDRSRVHPRDYRYALEMAASALLEEDAQELHLPESDEEANMKIQEAQANKNDLKSLNIADYSEQIREKREVDLLLTLHDIRHELMFPFHEWRTPWSEPDGMTLMYAFTGERKGCPLVGQLVRAHIISVHKRGPSTRDGSTIVAICLLDNGMKGEVYEDYLTSSEPADYNYDPSSLLVHGQSLQARIIGIDANHQRVQLATRKDYLVETKLKEYEKQYCGDEPYYDTNATVYTGERKDRAAEEERKEAEGPTVPVHRAIDHANFRNYNQKQAQEALDECEPGTHVFRPSSKGMDHISITIKLGNKSYLHMDVEESQKSTQAGAQLKLGVPLWVGNESYEDLDHLESVLVAPLSNVVQTAARHRKCRSGKREDVDKALANEKLNSPASIPYALVPSQETSGKFCLAYCPNASSVHVRHEYITPQSNGLRFRGKVHRDADRCINWFKRKTLQG